MAEPEAQPTGTDAPVETLEGKESLLNSILSKVEVETPSERVTVEDFKDKSAIAERDRGAMVSAALRVFIEAVGKMETSLEKIDKHLVDALVAQIDDTISQQLDEVLHHEAFQKLESSWRGLKFLVDRTDFRKNVKIELLNVSKETLQESFVESPELIQSALYRHVYTNAYDQPGADPYAAVISSYEFENTPADMELLRNVSKVSASAHCPFIGSIGPKFFGKASMEEWKKIPDLTAYMETADFIKWNSFRQTEDARYVGLVFPRYMSSKAPTTTSTSGAMPDLRLPRT